MEGLKEKKYLQNNRKRFDPISLIISCIGLLGVFVAVTAVGSPVGLVDLRGLVIVIGGTVGSLLFQFDLSACLKSFVHILQSCTGTPDQEIQTILNQVTSLRFGTKDTL
jgi:flagellar motor component MotA